MTKAVVIRVSFQGEGEEKSVDFFFNGKAPVVRRRNFYIFIVLPES